MDIVSDKYYHTHLFIVN